MIYFAKEKKKIENQIFWILEMFQQCGIFVFILFGLLSIVITFCTNTDIVKPIIKTIQMDKKETVHQ